MGVHLHYVYAARCRPLVHLVGQGGDRVLIAAGGGEQSHSEVPRPRQHPVAVLLAQVESLTDELVGLVPLAVVEVIKPEQHQGVDSRGDRAPGSPVVDHAPQRVPTGGEPVEVERGDADAHDLGGIGLVVEVRDTASMRCSAW